ncbi:MAG: FGGY-family carbohydrate kinase [Rectinemataceae bacterium]
MERAVAVIDIGMTNKKVAVYDERLAILDSVSRTFDPIMVEGMETHDLEGMEAWFLDRLAHFARKYRISAVAVTTHGATLVCVGSDGRPCAPCVYYTYEPGEAFQERFYALAGDPVALQERTGTPRLSALINPAKGLFFLKERFPAELERSELVLNFPQYWGYRLTGVAGAEGTYTGCHTYLWDWKNSRISSVALSLGVRDKMSGELRDSWSVLGTLKPELTRRTGLAADVIVTMGIHDSNASLLPHIVKSAGRDFVLNSTGTWCVLMHPQEEYGFAPEELGKVVFFNRSAFNKPVKTAIFLGGLEYEKWSGLAAALGGGAAGVEPGPADYAAILRDRSAFIVPELVPGSGQFPGSKPRAVEAGREYALAGIESGASVPSFLREPRRAMAALNLSLALQTLVALERCGLAPGAEIFTEGGFRRNADYNGILAAVLPDNAVRLTDMAEATSFGAAMTALAGLAGTSPEALRGSFDIDYIDVSPMKGLDDFDSYREIWTDLASRKS